MTEEIDRTAVAAEIRSIILAASPEARELVRRVIEIEREKLHMKLPRHAIEEIAEALEAIVP